MKKSLIALAALATVATAAQAQSSVTMYGIMDGAVVKASGAAAGSQTAFASGGASSSRLGFRGTEDLGGGLSASFNLEAELNIATGAAGSTSYYGTTSASVLFNRAAFVGLGSKELGTLTLGRQNRVDYAYTASFDAFSGGNIVGLVRSGYLGSTANPNAAPSTHPDARYSNAVQYVSPSFNGLTLTFQAKVGGEAGDKDKASATGYGVRYVLGNLDLAASYHDDKTNTGTDSSETTGLYAAYNFGVAKVTVVNLKKKIANSAIEPTVTFVGAVVPVNNQITVLATAGKIDDAQNIANAKTDVFGLGVNYAFTKRTTAYIHHGTASNTGSTNNNYVSNLATAPAGGADHKVTGVGIRHTF